MMYIKFSIGNWIKLHQQQMYSQETLCNALVNAVSKNMHQDKIKIKNQLKNLKSNFYVAKEQDTVADMEWLRMLVKQKQIHLFNMMEYWSSIVLRDTKPKEIFLRLALAQKESFLSFNPFVKLFISFSLNFQLISKLAKKQENWFQNIDNHLYI